jgi:hypothetical protein
VSDRQSDGMAFDKNGNLFVAVNLATDAVGEIDFVN